MGNIGTGEIVLVLFVALLVLGPTRLPGAARQFGKAMAEFRRITSGLQTEMRSAISEFEREVRIEEDPPQFEPPPTFPAVEAPSVEAPSVEAPTVEAPTVEAPPAESTWQFPSEPPSRPESET